MRPQVDHTPHTYFLSTVRFYAGPLEMLIFQFLPQVLRMSGALCIRRTRTDADGRGHFIFIKTIKKNKNIWHTYIYGPNWSETQSQTAWVTPPPPPQLANYMSTMHRYRDGSVQEQVTYNSIRLYCYRWIIE